MLPQLVETKPGVRRFGDDALQAQIDRVLAALPEDHRAATVDVAVDKAGIVAVAAVRLNAGWSLQGALDKRFGGDWTGRASLRWSGK